MRPFPGDARSRRKPPELPQGPPAGRSWVLAAVLVSLSLSALHAQLLGFADGATSASSVRQNEFRSRWADYQVDRRPAQTTTQETQGTSDDAPTGLLTLVSRSFSDHFRNGPLQVRADLSAGYEFTNESNLRLQNRDGANTSPFVSPALGVFYNREIGPATISARYSVGYVYYLDQSYLAANHNGGILSQTGGLDIGVQGARTSLTSTTSASYGNGNDIESGTSRDLFTISEGLGAAYTLTDFTQLGVTASVSESSYSGGGSGTDTDNLYVAGTLYGDYVITGKTRLRLEFGAGDQNQGTGSGQSTSDRSYYQALLHVNYIPSAKITLDGGIGYGFQNDSGLQGKRGTDSHPVYTLTATYVPTEKTSVSAHFGYEGTDVEPDFSLQIHYQPRPNTTVALSVYQTSGFSTFVEAQNLVTRGVLGSVQQGFFQKVSVSLSSGAEQSKGYSTGSGQGNDFEDPYYFASVSFLYEINSSLALQGYYRGYTGQFGGVANDKGLQSRASLSLRLTF